MKHFFLQKRNNSINVNAKKAYKLWDCSLYGQIESDILTDYSPARENTLNRFIYLMNMMWVADQKTFAVFVLPPNFCATSNQFSGSPAYYRL